MRGQYSRRELLLMAVQAMADATEMATQVRPYHLLCPSILCATQVMSFYYMYGDPDAVLLLSVRHDFEFRRTLTQCPH